MNIVIFGTGEIAEIAHFYFTHDSDHQVVAFTVDAQYLDRDRCCGCPVVPFEELTAAYPPGAFGFFAALSYSKLNEVRAGKVAAGRSAGYAIVSYVSSRATIWPDLRHGENCFILEDNTIQPFVSIGANVTLWSGNHIGHHSVIEDNVFISSHVVISGGVTVGANSFIGVNATVRDHVKIGTKTVIGAGSLIAADCEPEGVYSAPAAERARVPSTRLRRI